MADGDQDVRNAIDELLHDLKLNAAELDRLRHRMDASTQARGDDLLVHLIFEHARDRAALLGLVRELSVVLKNRPPSQKAQIEDLGRSISSDPAAVGAPSWRESTQPDGFRAAANPGEEPIDELLDALGSDARVFEQKVRSQFFDSGADGEEEFEEVRQGLEQFLRQIQQTTASTTTSLSTDIATRRLRRRARRLERDVDSCLEAIRYIIKVEELSATASSDPPQLAGGEADRATASIIRLREARFARMDFKRRMESLLDQVSQFLASTS